MNNEKSILISFIIPMYNAELYIESCIESILNQDAKDIEILLIDDGSTDRTLEICQKLAERINVVSVFFQSNKGPAAARNNGLKKAKGKYIWFVDADDWIEDNAIQNLREVIKESHYDLISFDFYKEKNGNKKYYSNKKYGVLGHEEFSAITLRSDCHFGLVWSSLFSHSLLEQYNLQFNEQLKFAEDSEYIVRVSKYIEKVRVLDKAYYHYRVLESSLSREFSEGITDKYLQASEEIYKQIVNQKRKEMVPSFLTYMQSIIVYIVLNDIFHYKNKISIKEKMNRLELLLNSQLVKKAIKTIDRKVIGNGKYFVLYFIKSKNVYALNLISIARRLLAF